MNRFARAILLSSAIVPCALAQGVVTTVAGTEWIFPGDGRPALSAPIGRPADVAVDRSGNFYIADQDNFMVMRVSLDGVLRVVAGNGLRGVSGDGGPATAASLVAPTGVVVDAAGVLYIADRTQVRKVTPDGIITTVAGGGSSRADGVPATSALLLGPSDVAVDSAGNVYIAELGTNRIRKVSPDGTITTAAGNGQPGASGDNGPATSASLNGAQSIAVDAAGNLYIADFNNARFRRVSTNGIITTVAGGGSTGDGDGGPATSTYVNARGVAVDGAGNLYIATSGAHKVRRVSPNGIISTVAGTSQPGYSGDGGPAVKATLNIPVGVAVDAAGNVYIADESNERIRKVDAAGIISTVAGNGNYRYSGEGTLAISSPLHQPRSVAVDAAGNVYLSEFVAQRVRRVDPGARLTTFAGTGQRELPRDNIPAASSPLLDPGGLAVDSAGNLYVTTSGQVRKVDSKGIITTVAGSGQQGYSGDGQPAVRASLNFPAAVAVDRVGNLYIADTVNHRVRKVDTAGIITTVAGDGRGTFSGDGNPATQASLFSPQGVAVDTAGNLYISDTGNARIRRVAPDGRISTFAGTGQRGFAGDGGTAVSALLSSPMGLALDSAGNLYIADPGNVRVRRVSPDGRISTVAGVGQPGFQGDGGPATAARLNLPAAVAVDASGKLYIADQGNFRIRVVLPAPPSFDVSPRGLSFSVTAGGAPVTQQLQLSSSVAGLAFSITTSDGLSASPASGTMPITVQITAQAGELPPGTSSPPFSGSVSVTASDASPSVLTIPVSVVVQAAEPARFGLKPESLVFQSTQRGAAVAQTLTISNDGGGLLAFTATAETNSGGAWLSVSPSDGTATPTRPVSLNVTANPGTLNAGTYAGRITLASPSAGDRVVLVTLAISAVQETILLSQTGLTFTAVVGGGAPPGQNFAVINAGRGVMSWSASASTLSGGSGWLSLSPASGSSDASSTAPPVEVAVNTSGIPAGEYYGQIRVGSSTADNSPQFVSVVLNLLPAGSPVGPLVQPTGLVFTGVTGGASPGSQTVLVANLTSNPTNFVSGRLTLDGRNWFAHAPTEATVAPSQPVRIVVQPDSSELPSAVRRGVLTLLFSDGSARTVTLLLVTAGAGVGPTPSPRITQAGCAASQLLPVFTSLSSDFNVPAGWPTPVEVKVVDDCGAAMTAGSVVMNFSNGDPPLVLASLRDGRWSGTWLPRNAGVSQVTIAVAAEIPERRIRGTAQVTGGLRANQNPPRMGGVVSAASFVAQEPLAPGSLVSIFGGRLSEGTALSTRLPLETLLATTQATLAGRPLPLLFASEGQINAMVPYDVPVNTRHQLLIRRGATFTVPEPVTVAPAQPAVFTKDQNGKGQGIIVDLNNRLVEPGNAVRRGDAVVIYCSGLGAVDPPVAAGTAAGASPLSQTMNPVSVTIGEVEAQVFFAGLSPGFAGLYQVNAFVPADTSPGDAVPVVVRVAGQVSPPVTIAVR